MLIAYGLPLVHVTEAEVLASILAATSEVPAFVPKSSVVAFMVHDAVIVICTVMLAVAVPASVSRGEPVENNNREKPRIEIFPKFQKLVIPERSEGCARSVIRITPINKLRLRDGTFVAILLSGG